MKVIKKVGVNFVVIFACILILASSVIPPTDVIGKFRIFTRMIEFDYVTWTIDAVITKNYEASLDAPRYLQDPELKKIVLDEISLTRKIDDTQSSIDKIFADPGITNPKEAAADDLATLAKLNQIQNHLGPLAETILQEQVGEIATEKGLTLGGQTLPPLLFRVTQLPLALIISPRDTIVQTADISLLPGLSLDQIVALEKNVEEKFNVSALVTRIGGVGTYPTMVISTTDITFLTEVISHEWTHNYLTLRPLGVNYDTSPELRTMNETTANISGKEIGQAVLEKYYPEYAPQPVVEQPQNAPQQSPPAESNPPVFNFSKEMHATRVNVDKMLSEGKIIEAEAYMETRRKVFWDNGYLIRRLNQAYFAFNGAYADEPGGAAGTDPVGPAVRDLRQQSSSLAEFINRISWMVSFSDLQKAIQK
jgi:hypothetical protein